MTKFLPHGYISVREAVDRLGRELFPSEWTNNEYEARRGLISEDEWLKIKDVAPARGGGATGGGPLPRTIAATAATTPHGTSDPSTSSSHGSGAPGSPLLRTTITATAATAPHSTGDPSHRARRRYEDTCDRLRNFRY